MKPPLTYLQGMAESLRRVTFAYESGNYDACVEAMGEIQQQINAFVGWLHDSDERARVKDASKELAHYTRGPA